MKFGFKEWSKPTPKKVKWLAGLFLAIAAGIGGWGFFATLPLLQNIGGFCFVVGTVLPKFFAYDNIDKPEEDIG